MGLGGQVHEIITDFQFVQAPGLPPIIPGRDHGMGWMRSLSFTPNFTPNSDRVDIRTFSVLDPEDATAQLSQYMTSSEGAGRFPNWETTGTNSSRCRRRSRPTLSMSVLLNVHDFTINQGSAGQQSAPRIAAHRVNGVDRYNVVWEDDFNDNAFFQVKGRQFRHRRLRAGSPADNQSEPDRAAAEAGHRHEP